MANQLKTETATSTSFQLYNIIRTIAGIRWISALIWKTVARWTIDIAGGYEQKSNERITQRVDWMIYYLVEYLFHIVFLCSPEGIDIEN